MLESDELHKASVLVFANKQDVAGCMTATEISQQLSLQACITYNIQQIALNPCFFRTWENTSGRYRLAVVSQGRGESPRFASEFDPHLCFSRLYQGLEWIASKIKRWPWGLKSVYYERLGRTSIQIHSGILWCVMRKKQILVLFHIFSYSSNCLEILTNSVPTHVTKNCSNVMLWDVDHDHCPINNQFNLWVPLCSCSATKCCITGWIERSLVEWQNKDVVA